MATYSKQDAFSASLNDSQEHNGMEVLCTQAMIQQPDALAFFEEDQGFLIWRCSSQWSLPLVLTCLLLRDP